MCARLKDDGGCGFIRLSRCLMKEGVDGVLCNAVRRICVDVAVFDVLMKLLYVETSW